MLKSKAFWAPLCLGCLVLRAWPLGAVPTLTQMAQRGSPGKSGSSDQGAKRKVEFYPGTMGELLDKDGVHFGFSEFKAADGAWLTVLYGDFASSAKAKEYFEKRLAEAAKVIERETN